MAGMRFSLAALLWLTACCAFLWCLILLPPYFLERYRLVDVNTAKVYKLWLLEVAGRVALVAATFCIGLRVIRNRYCRQTQQPPETSSPSKPESA
jgi:hypothetical protein